METTELISEVETTSIWKEFLPDNEVTAMWIVAMIVIGGIFYLAPKMFKHYETRLKELSESYRKREDENQKQHRNDIKELFESCKKEREESNKLLCNQLALINGRLESIETEIRRA